MGEFVHFRGKDAILEAYERNQVPCCALCSGKDLLFCYKGDDVNEGSGLLGEFIDALKEAHSQGVYQLRMYQNPPNDINIGTKQNFSFKCRILDEEELETEGERSGARSIGKRLYLIEQQLASRQEEPEEEEPMPAWQAAIGAILNKPEMQNFLMGKLFGFMNNLFGQTGGPGAHAMNGVPPEARDEPAPGDPLDPGQLYNKLSPAERAALDQAMVILLERDPQIGTNLLKLANILKTNPGKYRTYASVL